VLFWPLRLTAACIAAAWRLALISPSCLVVLAASMAWRRYKSSIRRLTAQPRHPEHASVALVELRLGRDKRRYGHHRDDTVKPDFSEYTYAYALTRDFETVASQHFGAVLGPPLIPSLRQEGNLGYDVEIATVHMAVYLQFKLGEHVSRSHPDSPTWGSVNAAHYRFEFPAGHHQLPALQALEAAAVNQRQPVLVRYYAPAFRDTRDLAVHYLSNEVLEHSYGCSPGNVPNDGARHHLVTIDHTTPTMVLSEPRTVPNAAARDTLIADLTATDESRSAPGEQPTKLVDLVDTLREVCGDYHYLNDTITAALDNESAVQQFGALTGALGLMPILWFAADSAEATRTHENDDAATD
jgi:hypothetical protein